MQTDDLAAQMVREMFGECGYEYSEKAFVDANIDIARRYIEKAVATVAPDAFHDGYAAASVTLPMTADVKALVDALEAWASPISSGYEVPAAAQAILQAARTLTAQAEEIERLRARLEITDEISERYDGIACRDETIRQLEKRIAALKAAQEVGR